MHKLILFTLSAIILISCSSSNPRVENCKMACESKGRHTSSQIDHCKSMCDKYDK